MPTSPLRAREGEAGSAPPPRPESLLGALRNNAALPKGICNTAERTQGSV